MGVTERAAQTAAARKSRVQVTREGWWIDGQRRILLCASLFYFRVPKELWADRIERVAQAGYHALDVYIPWNYHEPQRGTLLFDGDRDVRAFFRLAQEAGLYIIARPGPYICSEYDGGALPAWLYPELGHPEVDRHSETTFHSGHRVLRQPDERFLHEVSRWYDAIFPILREEQLDAGGPVLAVQIDNELDFYPCTDPKGYLSFLKERALAHGITVPLLACSGEDGVSAATGDLEGVVPTANIYSRYRAPGLEERARRVRELLEERNAPLTITETDRNHFTLRRLLSAGARFLGPYLQASGHHTGYWAGQNNWGKPSTFLQTDYDFGGMIGTDGELRDEYYDGRVFAGMIAALEPELTTSKAGVSPVEVVEPGEGESAQNLRRLPASTLTSTLGARFVFVPNLGDQPLQVTSPLPATVLPHRVAVLSFDVDFASRGAPVKLVSSNAEICRLHKTDRALIAVVAFDPLPAQESLKSASSQPDGPSDGGAGHAPPSPVELVLEAEKGASVLTVRGLVQVEPLQQEAERARWRITVPLEGHQRDDLGAALVDAGDSRLVLLFAPRWLAGRAWEVTEAGPAGQAGQSHAMGGVLHLGWDWVSADGSVMRRHHGQRVYRVTPTGSIHELPAEELERRSRPLSLPAATAQAYDRVAKPDPLARLRSTPAEKRWQGDARYLETLGVYYGAAYYRFRVTLDRADNLRPGLWINGASDAVSFYINGRYLGTALPRGRSVWLTGELPWQPGENEVVVRAEIMGHSNFHDTTVPVTHLGSMRGLAGPVVLSETSPGESEYERHAREDRLPSRDPGFIYGAPKPAGTIVETTWELWREPLLEPEDAELPTTGPHAFPLELEGGAFAEVRVPLPDTNSDIPLWARLVGKEIKGELWLGRRLVGRFWLSDNPDVAFTGGRWPDRIWLPQPWLSEKAITLRLLGTGRNGGVLERIEWLRSMGGA